MLLCVQLILRNNRSEYIPYRRVFCLVKKIRFFCFTQMTRFYSLTLRIYFHFLINMNPEKYFPHRDQN